MSSRWRNPLLPVGALLFALGVGNTWVSADKVEQYGRRLETAAAVEMPADLSELEHLTARTNASILRRLHRGAGQSSVAAAKRDFYTLVYNGGRLIALLGLLLALFGLRAVLLDPRAIAERHA